MKLKKEHIILTGILLIGIVARMIKFGDPAMVMDTVAFSRLGKNLIEYGRYAFGENYNMGVFFPPGYPVFIGLTNLIFHDLFFSAKFVSFIASCASIVLSYLLCKELYDGEAGLFAALVFALYPVILIVSVDAYADALFFCLLLLSLYIFIRSLKKDNSVLAVLFSIAMAAMFLTRPEGLFLLLLPVLRIFGFLDKKIHFERTYIPKVALIFIIFTVIISPYMLFLKNYTGKYTISGKGNVSIILGELSGDKEYHDLVNAPDNLYDRAAFVLNEDKTQLRGWNREANLSLKDYIMKNPAALLKKYQKNVMRQISTLMKLLVPIMLPLFFSFFNRDLFKNRPRLLFLLYSGLFFFIYPFFIIIEKQTLLIALFLIIFSSGGFPIAKSAFFDIVNYYGSGKNKVILLFGKNLRLVMIIVLILSSITYLKYSSFDKVPRPVEHKRAGIYVREHIRPKYEELNIMGRKPFVNFYSNARFTMIPYANATDVINFAKLYGVDYIVIDERFLGKWVFYNELTELQRYSDDVKLYYEDDSDMLIKLFGIRK